MKSVVFFLKDLPVVSLLDTAGSFQISCSLHLDCTLEQFMNETSRQVTTRGKALSLSKFDRKLNKHENKTHSCSDLTFYLRDDDRDNFVNSSEVTSITREKLEEKMTSSAMIPRRIDSQATSSFLTHLTKNTHCHSINTELSSSTPRIDVARWQPEREKRTWPFEFVRHSCRSYKTIAWLRDCLRYKLCVRSERNEGQYVDGLAQKKNASIITVR